ncbi:MAG: hypothetical protein MUE85_18085 [Microscillaceae bacterium]|jgi:hypothetical protein|nr:hypothetical protein [Microscillaceae bacterium]
MNILLDAFIPIFTFSALLFVVPAMALLILVLLWLRRRKLAFWFLLAIPLVLFVGIGADYWLLQSGSTERKKRIMQRQLEERKKQDSLKILNDSLIKPQ